jgi:uncharacterized ferritin-like protein (DUF455 family)
MRSAGTEAEADSTPETAEAWARRMIKTTIPGDKLAPPVVPLRWQPEPISERIAAPGRPASWNVVPVASRTPKPRALAVPRMRAKLLHTFLHHELQAAELLCWALLAFPDTPRAFRRGLVRIAQDEIRHLQGYRALLQKHGSDFGDFPIRDWFWERVPSCRGPAEFVAVMGMGLEAANLEHAPAFAEHFAAAGDVETAAFLRSVAKEEVGHVKFGVRWFRRFTGNVDFETWQAHLPEPLSPLLMRGKSLDLAARRQAGMPSDFLSQLGAWKPTAKRLPNVTAR